MEIPLSVRNTSNGLLFSFLSLNARVAGTKWIRESPDLVSAFIRGTCPRKFLGRNRLPTNIWQARIMTAINYLLKRFMVADFLLLVDQPTIQHRGELRLRHGAPLRRPTIDDGTNLVTLLL